MVGENINACMGWFYKRKGEDGRVAREYKENFRSGATGRRVDEGGRRSSRNYRKMRQC